MNTGKVIISVVLASLLAGCATTSNHEMTPKEEARYAAAIDKADAEQPSAIPEGSSLVVAVGESAAEDAAALSADGSADPRNFKVSRPDFDAFFAQSPAVVLARMTLDPITDGGTLLGYRVLDLKEFPGVDLKNEDIIVGIDGVLPKTPDDYFSRWENAKTSGKCTVNVQRGMERFELVWIAE